MDDPSRLNEYPAGTTNPVTFLLQPASWSLVIKPGGAASDEVVVKAIISSLWISLMNLHRLNPVSRAILANTSRIINVHPRYTRPIILISGTSAASPNFPIVNATAAKTPIG